MVVTLPIRRRRITFEKVVAMVLQAAAIVVVVTVVLGFGHLFHVTVGLKDSVGTSLGVLLLGLDLGLVALVVGAATGSRGVALGVASAIGALSYLVSSLAPVVAWVRPARFISLFYWSVGNNQLTSGLSLGDLAVLVGSALALTALAALSFDRLDLH